MAESGDSVEAELRVGMLDMALAKLLSSQHHTIEFPVLLLPENVEAGSIIKLTCTRAAQAEQEDYKQFEAVQSKILENFATNLPKTPVLRIHNVTQTSVVLEWDPIDIASSDLRYLALYKDEQRLGLIPQALKRTAMKVSNLEIDMPYKFRLVLSTSAGDFESEAQEVQTHKMSDLSGVVVCIGSLNHSAISASEIGETLERLGCKPAQDAIKLNTTHFLCTTEGGSQYDRATELSIPIVRPEWLKACEAERKLVSVRGYYLSADPQAVPPPRERAMDSPQVSSRREEEQDSDSEQASSEQAVPEHGEPAEQHGREVDASESSPNSSEPHAKQQQHVRFDVPTSQTEDAQSDVPSEPQTGLTSRESSAQPEEEPSSTPLETSDVRLPDGPSDEPSLPAADPVDTEASAAPAEQSEAGISDNSADVVETAQNAEVDESANTAELDEGADAAGSATTSDPEAETDYKLVSENDADASEEKSKATLESTTEPAEATTGETSNEIASSAEDTVAVVAQVDGDGGQAHASEELSTAPVPGKGTSGESTPEASSDAGTPEATGGQASKGKKNKKKKSKK